LRYSFIGCTPFFGGETASRNIYKIQKSTSPVNKIILNLSFFFSTSKGLSCLPCLPSVAGFYEAFGEVE